jgi:hypothetical protein
VLAPPVTEAESMHDEEATRVWLEGYGSRLVARSPFELARLDAERVVLAHHHAQGVVQVMVAPDTGLAGGAQVALGPGTTSMADVLSLVEECAPHAGWMLVTRELTCAWPAGMTVWSTSVQVDWPFELTWSDGHPDDGMCYLQGPLAVGACPALDELVAPGMQVTGRGDFAVPAGAASWIEMQYPVGERLWWQRRFLVPVAEHAQVLITAQASEPVVEPLFEATATVVQTVAARR